MKTSAFSLIACRIFVRQSSPGHTSAVSRHTGIPAASNVRCNLSALGESSRTYEIKTCPGSVLMATVYSCQARQVGKRQLQYRALDAKITSRPHLAPLVLIFLRNRMDVIWAVSTVDQRGRWGERPMGTVVSGPGWRVRIA